jgi:hypothetical protein
MSYGKRLLAGAYLVVAQLCCLAAYDVLDRRDFGAGALFALFAIFFFKDFLGHLPGCGND